MKAFKIIDFKDAKSREAFEKCLLECTTEMFATGDITEDFYDKLVYIDKDAQGNE